MAPYGYACRRYVGNICEPGVASASGSTYYTDALDEGKALAFDVHSRTYALTAGGDAARWLRHAVGLASQAHGGVRWQRRFMLTAG